MLIALISSTRGVANLMGLPNDFTTEHTEITEKKLLKSLW